MPVTRKLAAIMFTDIKDFTKRMNASESLGMRLMRTHNEVMDGVIQRHGGVLVKNIGDAYLVDFGSAVNAVEAAVEAQQVFARIHEGARQEEEMLVRISIHLGDVVVQDADMFGDGVNVASRLQSLTPPGGICISREVHTHVKSKVAAECICLGSHALKGVEEPVEVYQVLTALVPRPVDFEPSGSAAVSAEAGVPPGAAGAPAASIAVLPFANWSDDKESEYFSDGITEDIITDLAKISALSVSSRNSVFSYKGKTVEMKKVGAELNVRYVLEGSVRKSGPRLRITAQLIETQTNAHVWAERWDRELADVFAIQDEIARTIAGELRVRLTPAQEKAIENRGTQSLQAYDEYLKGLFFGRKRTARDSEEAVVHLQAALALDADFALAHSALAWTFRYQYALGVDRGERVIQAARTHAERAVALDPQLADASLVNGLILREEGRLPEAIRVLQGLVERYPSHAPAHSYLGNAFREVGYFPDAIRHHARAMELEPRDFIHPLNLCEDFLANGNVRDLDPMLERARALAPGYHGMFFIAAESAAAKGDLAEAGRLMDLAAAASPGHAHFFGARGLILQYTGHTEEAYRQMRSFVETSGDAPIVAAWAIPAFVHMGKLEDASALIDRTLAASAARFINGLDARSLALYYRGAMQRSRGDREGARESFLQCRASLEEELASFPRGAALRSWHALLQALCGESAKAVEEADAVQRDDPRYVRFAYPRSLLCAALHDRDGLLSWISKLRQESTPVWWGLRSDPGFSEYADDPGFLAATGQ